MEKVPWLWSCLTERPQPADSFYLGRQPAVDVLSLYPESLQLAGRLAGGLPGGLFSALDGTLNYGQQTGRWARWC